jgi:sialic acid synthase SpsE/mannose-6-phosphate isomerase-like protein (cupin superfamily)
MAGNHQGSVAHGKRIIDALYDCAAPYGGRFRFAVKFQYRDLDGFIHPAMRGRTDIKHIKRFLETRLVPEQFTELLAHVRACGFTAVCTPFDEVSVTRVREQGFDFLKIASCSFGDWPLMEAAATAGLPVIASAAGSDMETVRNVVSFFRHRQIPLILMHCVGEYPTPGERLQMNQIDLFRREFPELTVGFSTHEAPDAVDPVKIAVAKGARVFEKHVGLPADGIVLNAYSANPPQVSAWLAAADAAFSMCGLENTRYVPGEKELADLDALRRGLFVQAESLPAGHALRPEDIYSAFPCLSGQFVAQDFSKYARFTLRMPLGKDAPLMRDQVNVDYTPRRLTARYVAQIIALLKAGNAVVPIGSMCDLSHHYGLEKFPETGLALIDCINREYCKKLLVLLPGQSHPVHRHVKKEETFFIVHGDLTVTLDDISRTLHRGESMTVERRMPHAFSSENGCVFEEISSTHCSDDSYYNEAETFVSPRKTRVFLTKDVLD